MVRTLRKILMMKGVIVFKDKFMSAIDIKLRLLMWLKIFLQSIIWRFLYLSASRKMYF